MVLSNLHGSLTEMAERRGAIRRRGTSAEDVVPWCDPYVAMLAQELRDEWDSAAQDHLEPRAASCRRRH
jgi:hypothetical protein